MKICYLVVVMVCFILSWPNFSKENSKSKFHYPVLTGPYLGQKIPGEKPEVFGPGIVSTFMREGSIVVTPDGREIFYDVFTPKLGDQKGLDGTIVTIKEIDGIWTSPRVASFSGEDSDGYLTIHPDGKRIYFNSSRKTNREDLTDEWNIWFVEKTEKGWGDARPMEPPINGDGYISCFSVAKNNNAYFTKNKGKRQMIYRSSFINGKYGKPEELPKNVNSVDVQFDTYISPDEDYLIVPVYDRPDSLGGTDLYVSFRDIRDNWSPLVNLGPLVNTKNVEGSASISADGKYVFYSAFLGERKEGKTPRTYDDLIRSHAQPVTSHGLVHHVNDIYWFDAKYIKKLKKKL